MGTLGTPGGTRSGRPRRRRIAVLSDVHGHLTALRAVLADCDALGVDEIVVAGDIVNFGPNSAPVADLLRERRATMIRGNHEVELVATYGTPQMPVPFRDSVRFALARWTMQRLGPERRAFLTALPDHLWLDDLTIVCHGSPRHNRDGIRASHTEAQLRQFYGDPPWRLAFVGHTHIPVIRDVVATDGQPDRRFVNAGSVGFNLDEDPRTGYALAERDASDPPGEWRVSLRRIAYDVDAAVREYDATGYRDLFPEHAEAFTRQVRTGRRIFGPWVQIAQHLPEEEILPSFRRFLAENA